MGRVVRHPIGGMLAGLVLAVLGFGPATAQQAAALPVADCADDGRSHPIVITVTDIQKASGSITVYLYDDRPDAFLDGEQKVLKQRFPAQLGEVVVCVPAPRPGTYAVALYHDVNANTDFDRNFLGLPTEPFGISNNPRLALSRPDHADAAFSVPAGGAALTIKLVR